MTAPNNDDGMDAIMERMVAEKPRPRLPPSGQFTAPATQQMFASPLPPQRVADVAAMISPYPQTINGTAAAVNASNFSVYEHYSMAPPGPPPAAHAYYPMAPPAPPPTAYGHYPMAPPALPPSPYGYYPTAPPAGPPPLAGMQQPQYPSPLGPGAQPNTQYGAMPVRELKFKFFDPSRKLRMAAERLARQREKAKKQQPPPRPDQRPTTRLPLVDKRVKALREKADNPFSRGEQQAAKGISQRKKKPAQDPEQTPTTAPVDKRVNALRETTNDGATWGQLAADGSRQNSDESGVPADQQPFAGLPAQQPFDIRALVQGQLHASSRQVSPLPTLYTAAIAAKPIIDGIRRDNSQNNNTNILVKRSLESSLSLQSQPAAPPNKRRRPNPSETSSSDDDTVSSPGSPPRAVYSGQGDRPTIYQADLSGRTMGGTVKTRQNAKGHLIRKDGRPDKRSGSSAANLRKAHAAKRSKSSATTTPPRPRSILETGLPLAPGRGFNSTPPASSYRPALLSQRPLQELSWADRVEAARRPDESPFQAPPAVMVAPPVSALPHRVKEENE